MTMIIVTGGAGSIGSHLCDLLLDEGHHVVAIDDLSTGRKGNLTEAAKSGAGFELVALDVRETRLCEVFEATRPDVVFHLAPSQECARRSATRGRTPTSMSWASSTCWSAPPASVLEGRVRFRPAGRSMESRTCSRSGRTSRTRSRAPRTGSRRRSRSTTSAITWSSETSTSPRWLLGTCMDRDRIPLARQAPR